MAAHIASETAAGSSTTRSRTPKNPKSVFAFAPWTCTRVSVARWITFVLWLLSSYLIANLAKLSPKETKHDPGLLERAGNQFVVGTRHKQRIAGGHRPGQQRRGKRRLLPFPRGIDSAAISMPGAKAARRKRRWKGRIDGIIVGMVPQPSVAAPSIGSLKVSFGSVGKRLLFPVVEIFFPPRRQLTVASSSFSAAAKS